MKLATHNTMSYQKPKQWWLRPFAFTSRCQRVDYKKQYELGARGFDLRIMWDDKGQIEFRHGIARYSADNLYDVLEFANQKGIAVRILLEIRDYNMKYIKNQDELRKKFIDFCGEVEAKYENIKFYGGRITGTWEQIYKFTNNDEIENSETGLYSSVTSLFVINNKWLKILDDWYPYLYAKWMNRQNIDEYSKWDDNWLISVDFIDIQ